MRLLYESFRAGAHGARQMFDGLLGHVGNGLVHGGQAREDANRQSA